MAIVRRLEALRGLANARHTEAQCTYSIVSDEGGKRWLQIDTYGSAARQLRGKKSQSVRFAPEAITQLRRILDDEFPEGSQ